MKTEQKKFDPATFIGKNWSIESDNGFNPDDLSSITLKNFHKEGEDFITGEQILERMGENKALNADAFLRFWEHQDQIPESWNEPATIGWIEFTGTVLRDSDGGRCFLVLDRRGDGAWRWLCHWLDDVRRRQDVSPLLASSTKSLEAGTLPLELEINGFTYRRV